MSKHRPPPRLTVARVAIADGAVLAIGLTFAVATSVAPHATAPVTAAAPTAIERTREPSGHGGPINPPTFPTDAWQPEDGPLIVDGQALPAPEAVTTAPVETEAAPEPTREETSSPAPAAKAEPAAEPEPQPELLRLVNADRAAAGCGPVAIAGDLTSQAQTHSNGQAAADSMFHSAGASGYSYWGENVAYGYETEAEAESGWMGSEPHRANIENCDFSLMGFAFADSTSGVRYWTQVFAA